MTTECSMRRDCASLRVWARFEMAHGTHAARTQKNVILFELRIVSGTDQEVENDSSAAEARM